MPFILLAEREPASSDQLKTALTAEGWQVRAVQSCEQAVRAALEQTPNLVLVDGQLAGASDLIRQFSRQSGGPGVILLAGSSKQASVRSMPELDGILTKPYQSEKVVQAVRERLAVPAPEQPTSDGPAQVERIYTSQDIFGDLLDDLGGPSQQQPTVQETPGSIGPERVPATAVSSIEPAAEAAAQPGSDQEPEPGQPPVAEVLPTPAAAQVGSTDQTAAAAPAPGPRLQESERAVLSELLAVGMAGTKRPSIPSPVSAVEGLVEKTLAELKLGSVTAPAPAPGIDHTGQTLATAVAAPALPLSRPKESTAKSQAASAEAQVDALLEKTLTGVRFEDLKKRAHRRTPPPRPAGKAPTGEQPEDHSPAVSQPRRQDQAAMPAAQDHSLAVEVEADVLSVPQLDRQIPPQTPDQAPPVELPDVAPSEPTPPEPPLPEPTPPEPQPPVPISEDQVSGPTSPEAQDFVRELGDYRLEEKIGVGAMAIVWRARRKGVEGFEKIVALKTILPHFSDNPIFVERFIDEAKLAAQLSHNNITQIYDLGKAGDEFFIAMEYVDGRDLRTILDAGRIQDRPLPVGLALLIASRITMALDYAHRKRDAKNRSLELVHRDVSPRNILISIEGEIKLCDFGIAKAVTKASTTQIGELKGKLMYMSPEQAWGKPADARSDIFAAGAVLYEILAGEPLFSGDTEIAILEAARRCQVETRLARSGIPAPAQDVLRQALARNPEDRFQTAGELQLEIDRLHHSITEGPGQRELATYLDRLFEASKKAETLQVPAEAGSASPEPASTPQADAEPPVPASQLDQKTVPVAPGATTHEVEEAEKVEGEEEKDSSARRRRILAVVGVTLALLLLSAWLLLARVGGAGPIETSEPSASEIDLFGDLPTPTPRPGQAMPATQERIVEEETSSSEPEAPDRPRTRYTSRLSEPQNMLLGDDQDLPEDVRRQLEEELRRIQELLAASSTERSQGSDQAAASPSGASSRATSPTEQTETGPADDRSPSATAPASSTSSGGSRQDVPSSPPPDPEASADPSVLISYLTDSNEPSDMVSGGRGQTNTTTIAAIRVKMWSPTVSHFEL